MRLIALLAPMLLLLGCAPIESVVQPQARIPGGSGITVLYLGPDPAGIEHALHRALTQAGYPTFSGALRTVSITAPKGSLAVGAIEEQEISRKFETPYVCYVKSASSTTRVASFTVQVLEVASGKVLVSLDGRDGSHSSEQIGRALVEQLQRMVR